MDILVSILSTTLRMATPLTLGALSGIFCERSGVVNIAIEGMMLTSAFFAFVFAYYAKSLMVGLVAGILSGALMAALHAILSVRFKVDQIISGTVINILAVGVTGYYNSLLFAQNVPIGRGSFPIIKIPLLSDIPIIGRIFFQQQPIVMTAIVMVFLVHILLFYTPWGLRTRAVGEYPRAADTMGINVFAVRYTNVIIGGMVAGLGGTFFTLESIPHFEPLMTNGRGFIALAAMIFGKWTPLGAWGASLLFGGAEALQINLQILKINLPYQFIGMLPYILTMIILAGVVGRANPPAAVGQPYEKY